jgi:IS30 family transposase
MKAIATLVERKTRFVMLIALPNGHAADVVADALAQKIVELPEQLRRSLTPRTTASVTHLGPR